MPDRFAPIDASAHDELRQIARDAYARGDLNEAVIVQRKVLASGPPVAQDAMFLALLRRDS